MTAEAVQRKLTAILSADAVGYSRLMARDEAATVKTLNAHRGLIGGLVRQHGGRVVDAVGDNLMAEFPSVVDAVACAVLIQEELAERNADLPSDGRMLFRIGINLGDVVVEGDQVYGDGVNIAARLEALAEAGGICISGTVHEQVRDKLARGYDYIGERALKNIAHPVRVYRVGEATKTGRNDTTTLTVPGFAGRPAIAVLAFDNLSGDPEQEYFADGIAEDLINRLSNFRLFPVIARNSSFTYKGKSVDLKQVSRELGVRYVVEGSVRKASDRVRVSAQLIDATTGHHVWAERYDRDLSDVFALQDEITETIIGALEPALEQVERERVLRQPPQNLDAWDCVQRGSWHIYQVTKEDFIAARGWFEKAIELDPHSALAYAYLATFPLFVVTRQWSDNPAKDMTDGLAAAEKAVALGPTEPLSYITTGWLYTLLGRFERARAALEKAIELNPSSTLAYFAMGSSLIHMNKPDDAVAMIEKAIRLSPNDGLMSEFLYHLGLAHFVAGRYEESAALEERSLRLRAAQPMATRILAASYGYLGYIDKARAALDAMHKLMPSLSVETLRLYLPEPILEQQLEGLRKAGWKEG